LKAVHEQEVSELSRLQTIVGFDPAQFYRTELERAIRDIRGDFEQLNQEQKRELEEWYRIKTEEVEKEVAKEREFQRVAHTGLTPEESNVLKQTHVEHQRDYIDLQKKHSELSARLRELEERLEQSKSTTQITLAERDRDIANLRDKIAELMSTYDELMNRKTSLEFEINTYRRLLECEETRIRTGGPNYSYSSSTSRTTTSSHQPSNVGASVITTAVITNIGAQPGSNNNNNNNAGGAHQDPTTGGSRTSFTQRASSTELSSETITKRMQVQRTSKGISEGEF